MGSRLGLLRSKYKQINRKGCKLRRSGAHEHIEIPALDPEQRAALENLYRATHKARLRTRAQTPTSQKLRECT